MAAWQMAVRERFVRNILEEEGARMLRNQSLAMRSAVRFRTRKMFDDRTVTVQGGAGMDGRLTFTHTSYERFLDMKRLRRGSDTIKSNRKIHNRFVYGTYISIGNRLMYDFTEDVAESIRKQIAAEQ